MRLPEISVHPFAPAGLFLVLFSLPRGYAFAVVFVTLLHELGHAAAARVLGGRIEKISIMPMGISMNMSPARSYRDEVIIAAAGPLQNIFCMVFSRLFVCSEEIFAFSLLSLGVNILPIRTLDGGRIIYALVSDIFGAEAGEKAADAGSAAGLFLLWIVGIYIFFYTAENAALLIFCSYIFAVAILLRKD